MNLDELGEDASSVWSRKCLCKKVFFQPNSYANHVKTCAVYKRSVGASLEEAKLRYQSRKSRKGKGRSNVTATPWADDDDLDVDYVSRPSAGPSNASGPATPLDYQNTEAEGGGSPVSTHEPASPARDEPMDIDSDPPVPAELGRGHRVHRAVQHFKDFAATSTIPFNIPSTAIDDDEWDFEPPPPGALPMQAPDAMERPNVEDSPSAVLRRTILNELSWRSTLPNEFGLYRRYWTPEDKPYDPDLFVTSEDLRAALESPELQAPDASATQPDDPDERNPYFPFPNWSSFRLGDWYWDDRREKGRESFRQLVSILTSDDFDTNEIRTANWETINELLAASEFDEVTRGDLDPDWFGDGTSWRSTSVPLEVPFNRTSLEPGVHTFHVPNFRYRPLVPIITERLQGAARGDLFHVVPSDLRWQPRGPGGPDIRVYGEMYHSPAVLEAYKEIQSLPLEPTESSLPRYVVAIILASDETMLTSFGSNKLWPAYLMFGNESKNRRGKPSLKLFEEVAYFQSVPDDFQDWYLPLSGKKNVSTSLSTHLNRELFQAQWRILLDDEFIEAYTHGIAVDCGFDGIRRRFYPRIFAVTIVGIRNMGDHPCPRCLVSLVDIHRLGTAEDMAMRNECRRRDDKGRKDKIEAARRIIHKQNYCVNTPEVEKLLKPTSLVPAKNAFSDRLSASGLDVYRLIAVDILHEVEIGVWKSLFIQLLRILEVSDKSLQNTLNTRFRQMPTFGTDTIRRFGHNVSEMKQLAARDYEDILQCAIAAFEGLVAGEHGERILDLLFTLAHWHSLTKLRLHTDDTLALLDEWTIALGAESRHFVELTCAAFETRELKREYEARKRNEARRKSKDTNPAPSAGLPGDVLQLNKPGTPLGASSSNATTSQRGAKSKSAQGTRAKEAQPKRGSVPKTKSTKSKRGAPQTQAASNDPSQPERSRKDDSQPGSSHLQPLGSYDAQAAAGGDAPFQGVTGETSSQTVASDSRQFKTWSLNTSKFHSMGDVADYIRMFGTTDSYSTQLSERFHRFPKSRFRRTNKKHTSHQLSRIQTRQTRIKKLRRQLTPAADEGSPDTHGGDTSYFIGKSQNNPVQISHFLRINFGDLATKGFVAKLRFHLLPRVLDRLLYEARQLPERHSAPLRALEQFHSTGLFSNAHLNGIYIHSDRFYRHKVLQVYYTTYDCRRACDTLNPSTSRRYIMCLAPPPAPSESSPAPGDAPSRATSQRFVYGCILGVFHVNVIYGGPGMIDHHPRRFDFLWVRWFDSLDAHFSEATLWLSKRMERVSLRHLSRTDACDFVDPSDVIRAAHIVPRFKGGKRYSEELHFDRIASKCANDADDWDSYYINPFVDRDMTMRFHWGMSVGHLYTHEPESQRQESPAFQISNAPLAQPLARVLPDKGRRLGDGFSKPVGSVEGVMEFEPQDNEDSDDSAYDRPQGSDVDLDNDLAQRGVLDLPDVQEPEDSDRGDDAYT